MEPSEVGYINFLESEVMGLESMIKWIPVSERLPEEDNRYLIVYSRVIKGELGMSRIYVSDYDACNSKWINLFNDVKVTHWLPLPPLPEDV
jgi:hypothetical protein